MLDFNGLNLIFKNFKLLIVLATATWNKFYTV